MNFYLNLHHQHGRERYESNPDGLVAATLADPGDWCWVCWGWTPLWKLMWQWKINIFLIGDRSSNGWFFSLSFVRFSGVHFSFENDQPIRFIGALESWDPRKWNGLLRKGAPLKSQTTNLPFVEYSWFLQGSWLFIFAASSKWTFQSLMIDVPYPFLGDQTSSKSCW